MTKRRPGDARRDLHGRSPRLVHGQPRPVVIVQDDRFDATASLTVCPLTTNPVDATAAQDPGRAVRRERP